jgi:NAD+ diphosphatase
VGLVDGRPHWLCAVEKADAAPPAGWHWHDTRALLGLFSPEQWQAISCARQLLWWERRHRFCGVCGTPTLVVADERARRCPKCGASFFPAASPAVIVAVTRGDELLLAHNRNFRPGVFSLLAGFVDPGETFEQAAEREVREEVSIRISELRYVASQPWSFPNSLMVAFRARHAGGEIAVDRKEIEEARWCRRSAMPQTPNPGTIARRLIEQWLHE